MAYEKTTWVTGDTITAEKLNHMEGGIEGVGLLSLYPVTLDCTNDEYTIDKTVQEVRTAILAGKTPVLIWTFEGVRTDMAVIFPLIASISEDELYVVWATPAVCTVTTIAGSPPSGSKCDISGQRVMLDDYALTVEWIQGEVDGQFGSPTKYVHEFS